MQFFDQLSLPVPDVLDEFDGRVADALLRRPDRLLASVQRIDLRVELGNLRVAIAQQLLNVLLVLLGGVGELRDLVISVFVESAQDTNAGIARLAVEADGLVAVFLAFDVLFRLHVEYRVVAGHLRLAVELDAVGAQQLGAVQTLGGCLAVFAAQQFTNVTERILRRMLPADQLGQTGYQEIVG